MDPAWEEETAQGEELPAPRVVFEPPRFVTLPPGVMPEPVVANTEPVPTEPPVEPALPSLGSEPLPEVAPLLLTEDSPSPKLPDLPLLTTDIGATVEPKATLDEVLAQVPPVPPGPGDLAPPALPEDTNRLLAPTEPVTVATEAASQPGQAPGLKMKAAVNETKLEEVTQHLAAGMLPSLQEPETKPESKSETGGQPAAAEEQAPPTASVEELPDGIPAPGRPHLLRSPRAGELQLVDVTGMAPGDKVKCPFTGDFFRVPDPAKAVKAVSVAPPVVAPN